MTKLKAVMLDRATFACDLVKPDCVDEWEEFDITNEDQVIARIKDADVIVTNKVKINETHLQQTPKLKLIVVAATGYDIIDIQACRQHNVTVTNCPGYSVSSVPEHTVALMFALARSLIPHNNTVHDNSWVNSPIFCVFGPPIMELANKTLGIIGAGSLGIATGNLCKAIGMKVVYATSSNPAKTDDDLERLPLDELLAVADVVSLHCPLTKDNQEFINAQKISLMKDGAILINTSRGGLVNQQAVINALESGKLGGAGIDVLSKEPPSSDDLFVKCKHPNLLVTPHVAWASLEAQQRLAKMIATTTDSFFAGNPVNVVS